VNAGVAEGHAVNPIRAARWVWRRRLRACRGTWRRLRGPNSVRSESPACHSAAPIAALTATFRLVSPTRMV